MKKPRWFYYIVMECEECWHVELSMILSNQYLYMAVNVKRKVEAAMRVFDSTQYFTPVHVCVEKALILGLNYTQSTSKVSDNMRLPDGQGSVLAFSTSIT